MSTASTFASPQGLRALLRRLHASGNWRDDDQAADLMRFAMTKYGALAHKHGREPHDAAVAAFEVMCTRAAREADDPWAVITRAVQLALSYESRADGLLCSTGRAKKGEGGDFHDAQRLGERETPMPDQGDQPTSAFAAVDHTVAVFVALGWPEETAQAGVEYIANRLMRTGSRLTAFEYLRRDRYALALLDLSQRQWLVMLRAVLGNQHPDRAHTQAGRGCLLLVLIGYQVDDILDMSSLTRPIRAAVRAMSGDHVGV